MARGQRNRDKERFWRQHVTAHQRSGQTVRAYCDSAGLSEPSFYSWRRVLAERYPHHTAKPQSEPADPTTEATPAFLPVRVVPTSPTPATPTVEVLLRSGRVIRVAEGFDPTTLRAVVAVLEDLPC